MNFIENIVEPNRLLLIWQPHSSRESQQRRRLVGEIVRENEAYIFRYAKKNNPDFIEAIELGMEYYDIFLNYHEEYRTNVLQIFSRRLPPKTRSDYSKYLEYLRISTNARISDFALLGYSSAKLPSDNYSIVHPFEGQIGKCELLTEIAGFRFRNIPESIIEVGSKVSFEAEPENMYDPNAIKVIQNNEKLGYVNKFLCNAFHSWMGSKNIEATIERIVKFQNKTKIAIFVKIF